MIQSSLNYQPTTYWANVNPMYDEITSSAKDLLSSDTDKAINACKRINEIFNELIACTDQHLSANETKVTEMEIILIQHVTDYNKTDQDCKNNKKTLAELKAKSEGLASKKKDLNIKIQELNQKVYETKQKIRDEINTGIINPFYSLISIFKQTLKSLQEDLNKNDREFNDIGNQITDNNKKISILNENINEKEKELKKLKLLRDQTDIKIKQTGKRLTTIKNVSHSLKEASIKYTFLKKDMDLVKDCIEIEELEDSLVQSFISDIKKIQALKPSPVFSVLSFFGQLIGEDF
jgi:septal ring factor EnvC (AmiA/AmiB activator)